MRRLQLKMRDAKRERRAARKLRNQYQEGRTCQIRELYMYEPFRINAGCERTNVVVLWMLEVKCE